MRSRRIFGSDIGSARRGPGPIPSGGRRVLSPMHRREGKGGAGENASEDMEAGVKRVWRQDPSFKSCRTSGK